MDSIEQFDIETNISDRQHVYDYATCSLLTRPDNGKWNASTFNGLGLKSSLPEGDKKAAQRLHYIDRMYRDKRLLEKKMDDDKKHTQKKKGNKVEDSFPIWADAKEDLHLPQRVMPVYKPGETIRGQVALKLTEPIDAECVSLHYLNQAFINIRIYHRYGYTDHPAKEVYVDQTLLLWQRADGDRGGASMGQARLEAGVHTLPFTFTIPMEAKQSTSPLNPSDAQRGYIIHRLKAKINKGKLAGRGNINSHKLLWITTPFDIASKLENLQPLYLEQTLTTGVVCAPGRIILRASLPKKAFLLGSPIPMNLEINNQTNREIRTVEACIRMEAKIRTGIKKWNMRKNLDGAHGTPCCSDAVSPGMCPSYNWNILWDFLHCAMDGHLFPVGDLGDITIIDLSYYVLITVKRKLRINQKVKIPIVVGNYNSQNEADGSDGQRLFVQKEAESHDFGDTMWYMIN